MPSSLGLSRVFTCSQCPKIFATRSNLKRHMENPNIHNIPYVRSRDQKRWKGHAKKIISREETTERMRKWRAENRDKNKRNDLRCRVYRLARQRFGDDDSVDKQAFIREEIARRLGKRSMSDIYASSARSPEPIQPKSTSCQATWIGLPFYNAPHHKIELPLLDIPTRRIDYDWNPYLSTPVSRRTSSSSSSSSSSTSSSCSSVSSLSSLDNHKDTLATIPPYRPSEPSKHVKYVAHDRILDEFVGLVLDNAY
ncbi:hypothetical protein CLU79DRAFT_731187 [Phycomyces nitens]|nr:hypothetical protein CLU79DRAFT_731187 [Phycomyces nitens]